MVLRIVLFEDSDASVSDTEVIIRYILSWSGFWKWWLTLLNGTQQISFHYRLFIFKYQFPKYGVLSETSITAHDKTDENFQCLCETEIIWSMSAVTIHEPIKPIYFINWILLNFPWKLTRHIIMDLLLWNICNFPLHIVLILL